MYPSFQSLISKLLCIHIPLYHQQFSQSTQHCENVGKNFRPVRIAPVTGLKDSYILSTGYRVLYYRQLVSTLAYHCPSGTTFPAPFTSFGSVSILIVVRAILQSHLVYPIQLGYWLLSQPAEPFFQSIRFIVTPIVANL